MSGFVSEASGIAASVYLPLYTIFLTFMAYVIYKRGFKTLFTFIFVFCILRCGGQLCGVAYAKVGPQYYKWLIAYLVLQAEGYFTLILTCFRFTCKAQIDKFGQSWVINTGPIDSGKLSWMRIFHYILIPANAFLIAGGSMTAGVKPNDYSKNQKLFHTAKGLRTAGQVTFLLMILTLIALNFYVIVREKIRSRTTIAVMVAGPLLVVRGIFGIMSIYIDDMNYFEISNYLNGGVNEHLVIYEYVLATTMEFLAAVVLMARYFVHKPAESELVDEEKDLDLSFKS